MKIKKIIAISGSPSKGWNSDTMLDAFIEGANKVPNVEVKKLYATDVNCDLYSFENRNGVCDYENELRELFSDIENSQGLIIATPTYNFSVPAGLKNIIDRMRPIALDMQKINIVGQPTGKLHYLKTYFLVSGGTPTFFQKLMFPVFPPLWLSLVFKYYGARLGGSIYGGGLKGTSTAADNKQLLAKARKAGKRYAENL